MITRQPARNSNNAPKPAKRPSRGASIVEVIILVSVICLGAIAALNSFSDRLAFRMRCADYALGGGTESSTRGGIDTVSVSEEDREEEERILNEMRLCKLSK